MLTTQIIGDEIWSDGYLIGLLAQHGVPATVLDTFVFEPPASGPIAPDEIKDSQRDYDTACDDIEKAVALQAKNGLLRVTDLKTIIKGLKEIDNADARDHKAD